MSVKLAALIRGCRLAKDWYPNFPWWYMANRRSTATYGYHLCKTHQMPLAHLHSLSTIRIISSNVHCISDERGTAALFEDWNLDGWTLAVLFLYCPCLLQSYLTIDPGTTLLDMVWPELNKFVTALWLVGVSTVWGGGGGNQLKLYLELR
jgi:hypothetical protein